MAKPMSKREYRILRNRVTTEWLSTTDVNSSLPKITELIMLACEDVGSSFSMRVYYSLLTNDIEHYLSLSINPLDYSSAELYMKDNFVVTLGKKYAHWDTKHKPKVAAMKAFIAAEQKCSSTNASYFSSKVIETSDAVNQVLLFGMRKIGTILGEVPIVADLPIKFGPGATYTCKGVTGSLQKLTGTLDVTPQAVDAALELLCSAPGWLHYHSVTPNNISEVKSLLTVIPGDRLAFVPKTAITDRPIAIGPTINGLLQKGYGSCIRKRLKRNGLHLNRAPEKHIKLAQRASKDASLATVDLTAASDNISFAVVMDLLPNDWFQALSDVRSEKYQIDDIWYDYHKFSAMGNGYTFELESLIFFALASAVCNVMGEPTTDVSVFGDDIILPTKCYSLLCEVLEHCGFEINKQKSFSTGYFRESCGGDYFNGIDTRGFYIKDKLTLSLFVRFYNHLFRSGLRYFYPSLFTRVSRVIKPYRSLISGPDDLTDDHIICDYPKGLKFNFVNTSYKRLSPYLHLKSAMVWQLYENMSTPKLEYPYMGELRAIALASYDENVLVSKVSHRTFEHLTPVKHRWNH